MSFLKSFAGFAHWLPRLALFGIFGYHGLPKITQTAEMAGMMGMPSAMVLVLGLAELTGAVLILVGGAGPEWATQVAGVIFCIVMIGAIALVHAPEGWNSVMGNNGMEFQVLIFSVSFYYATKGHGVK